MHALTISSIPFMSPNNFAAPRTVENAAKGLVQAMQYGIDRYPAIVFDGKAVVYGITDVRAATQRYQQWQAGEARP